MSGGDPSTAQVKDMDTSSELTGTLVSDRNNAAYNTANRGMGEGRG